MLDKSFSRGRITQVVTAVRALPPHRIEHISDHPLMPGRMG
ncbi:hypothetical protein [Roseimaritima multifibrata]|nr:hypothetical protein [Roseimaritima multifibrata]